jgi:uncharacterized protein (DUF1330 family)
VKQFTNNREKSMSAYLVFTREETIDPSELAIYKEKVVPTLGTFDLKILAAYGPHEVLEGEPTEGVVIVEFPTVELAKAWYTSPAYQAARVHRFKGSKYRCILVQGV